MKKVLVIVGAVLAMAGVGAGAFFLGAKQSGAADAAAAAPSKGKARKEASQQPGKSLNLGKITTNLADQGVNRYVQVEVELHLEAAEEESGGGGHGKGDKGGDEALIGMARHHVLEILRSKTAEQLGGDSGMANLRAEILRGVNESLGQEQVLDVYFRDFVVQ